MNRTIVVFLFFACLLLASAAQALDPGRGSVKIINHQPKTVICYLYWYGGPIYEQTGKLQLSYCGELKPGASIVLDRLAGQYDIYFTLPSRSNIDNSKLLIFKTLKIVSGKTTAIATDDPDMINSPN